MLFRSNTTSSASSGGLKSTPWSTVAGGSAAHAPATAMKTPRTTSRPADFMARVQPAAFGGTPLAIKVLSSEASREPDAVTRFVNEARAAGQLRTSHVVRVFDVGTTEQGVPFIVMELLEGVDLLKTMKTRGAIPIAEAV